MLTTNNGNVFTTEKINQGDRQGLAVLLNGELLTVIEENLNTEEISVYAYSDMKDDEFTHKIDVVNV